jgi:hypothetical protein
MKQYYWTEFLTNLANTNSNIIGLWGKKAVSDLPYMMHLRHGFP